MEEQFCNHFSFINGQKCFSYVYTYKQIYVTTYKLGDLRGGNHELDSKVVVIIEGNNTLCFNL